MKRRETQPSEKTLSEDEKKVSSIIPADFLIDENGRIAKAHYGSAINDHIPIEYITEFAQASQAQS
jgi:peroxiredoxin